MAEFAQSVTCRRMVLLNYFGESQKKTCGNCDICLYPPEQYDGLEDAQKVLSCIYRVEQRFGSQYIVDVLRGSARAQIKENRHDALSVYGIGKNKPAEYWHSIIRQLIHLGYIMQHVDKYTTLYLSRDAKHILTGEIPLQLAKPRLEIVSKSRVNRYARSVNQTAILSYDEKNLYGYLKRLRKRIADAENIPPYVIFSDATLLEMVQLRPDTMDALLMVSGVGQIKLEKYGRYFLDEIIEFTLKHS